MNLNFMFFLREVARPDHKLFAGMMLQSSRESNYTPHLGVEQHGTVFYRDSIARYRPRPEIGESCSIAREIKSLIREALAEARRTQPGLSADPDDYYLFNFSLGWEGLGHWEADCEVSDLSLIASPAPRHPYRAHDLATLRRRFADPPPAAGPWVYWMWSDNVVSRDEITRQIEEMAAAGIAGAEIRCLVARGFPGLVAPWYGPEAWRRLEHERLEYLSSDFVDVLAHTCAEAEQCGLKLATNLGMGWPPGGP